MALTISNVNIENFLFFILIFFVTVVLGNLIKLMLRKTLDTKISLRSSKVISLIAQYVIFCVGFYFGIIYVLQFDLKALAASLGVITLAIAFAAQQLVQNLIAGLIISFKKILRFEDWAEVGLSGIGRVTDVSLTHTTIRGLTGKVMYLSNATILSSNVANYSKSGFVEIPISISVSASADLDKVKQIALSVADKNKLILPKVGGEEKEAAKSLIKLGAIRNFLGKKTKLNNFKVRVLFLDIVGGKINVSIRIWIREINLKEDIVSEYVKTLQGELIKANITL